MTDEPHANPIDRILQRKILLQMREQHPSSVRRFVGLSASEDAGIISNLLYLQEHGLCKVGISEPNNGPISWGSAKITARGMDFLEDDGGLSAILGTVTIKFEADTLRSIISMKIDSAPITADEKSILRKTVENLSGTALKVATTDLVKSGLEHIPSVVEWLRTVSGL